MKAFIKCVWTSGVINMTNFLKNNWFKLGILIVLLLVSFSLLYYYVFFLPQKEQARLDHEKQVERERVYNLELSDKYQANKEQQNKILLDVCLAEVESNYQANFESLGSTKKASFIGLSFTFTITLLPFIL